ncbi:hypothetical protein [Streptomyces sp. NPDC086766]|uniref:hypothetical protein n=1 Tax=Streptomyces sp. NPDC086766 TaxID=3365754 RepID=UPI003812AF04
MKNRRHRHRLALGFLLPGLLVLSSSGCGTSRGEVGARSAGRVDSGMYKGCTDGRSLKEVERTYGLVIPEGVENLRFCDQEDWSGSDGEMQFDTSRTGLDKFLAESGHANLQFEKISSSGLESDWQKIPQGISIDGGVYVNRIRGCDNSIRVAVQKMRHEKVRVYVDMDCAS